MQKNCTALDPFAQPVCIYCAAASVPPFCARAIRFFFVLRDEDVAAQAEIPIAPRIVAYVPACSCAAFFPDEKPGKLWRSLGPKHPALAKGLGKDLGR